QDPMRAVQDLSFKWTTTLRIKAERVGDVRIDREKKKERVAGSAAVGILRRQAWRLEGGSTARLVAEAQNAY
ncbi:hypothetical protein PIB30_088289, partial [Stylosanthes scabra]|nr:hypothetical protein [Stylosanthes scabra]